MSYLITLFLLDWLLMGPAQAFILVNGYTDDRHAYHYSDTLHIQLSLGEDYAPDSVELFIDKRRMPVCSRYSFAWNTQKEKLGMHEIRFLLYRTCRDTISLKRDIELHSNIHPVEIAYSIVNKFPHDSLAFTQGLYYDGGVLYESTGWVGKSSLRKVAIATGKPIYSYALKSPFFGEGLTIADQKIYQLTWKNRQCFVYDLETMTHQKTLRQAADGWGLTHTDHSLVMSNGSNKLFYLNPDSLVPIDSIEVYDDRRAIFMLNELEMVDGYIYANIYQSFRIAKICPSTGRVLAYLDLSELKAKHKRYMNGIAYNPATGNFYITGKYWDTLYELDLRASQLSVPIGE